MWSESSLNAQNVVLLHGYMHRDFFPLINCVIDRDIDQALLQFIDVMTLVDLLLHFSPYFVIKRVQICADG